MKTISQNLDKIGILIFVLILVNFIFILFEYDYFNQSKWQYFDFGFFILVLSGFLLIFKPTIFKIFAFVLGVLGLIYISKEFNNISYFLKMLPHFIANKTITLTQVSYFFIFPFIVVLYSLFAITESLVTKFKKKFILK
ncbi:MAG: hypothetical protein M3405_01305 [Acidobacteriota bacterium]|nr:hypothetical protein [Acidobacteriota bacterium]